jgi:hypothetical protein
MLLVKETVKTLHYQVSPEYIESLNTDNVTGLNFYQENDCWFIEVSKNDSCVIFTDKIGQETDITVTPAFKQRLRHFAATVLQSETVPTIRELEKLYSLRLVKPRGIGADLTTHALNWMKLYAVLEDAAIRQEQIATEDHYQFASRSTQDIKAIAPKYDVVIGDHDTVVPTYSIKVMKKDVTGTPRIIGSISGDWQTKQYSVTVLGWSKGVRKPVTSPSQAINIMLSYFQKSPVC